ncbi:hypothetical protein BDV98DRAFT_121807 [Pterulicium gracile]|uniref:Uncharacterized protein n=1 Tax=Pterulicium gracile TaxID=1884261 RepID=A0A5C3QIY4_9AGAR|nr:hypothetical protein BDV98DRAFT_121807 [Pterula gracilis]
MLEPTRSYVHWIVDQELFCFSTDGRQRYKIHGTRFPHAFSVSTEIASAYRLLLDFLYSPRSKSLSPNPSFGHPGCSDGLSLTQRSLCLSIENSGQVCQGFLRLTATSSRRRTLTYTAHTYHHVSSI